MGNAISYRTVMVEIWAPLIASAILFKTLFYSKSNYST